MVHTSKPGALFAVRVQRTDDSDRGHNPETADQGNQKKDAVAETQKVVSIHDTICCSSNMPSSWISNFLAILHELELVM